MSELILVLFLVFYMHPCLNFCLMLVAKLHLKQRQPPSRLQDYFWLQLQWEKNWEVDDKQQMDQELVVQQRQWEEKMELEHDQPIFEESDVVQDYQVGSDHIPPGEQHFWGSVGCFPWKIR